MRSNYARNSKEDFPYNKKMKDVKYNDDKEYTVFRENSKTYCHLHQT